MPRSRRRLNSPAASAEPVEPPDTSACARPSATALAAWTIDASGVDADRVRRIGRLGDRDRARRRPRRRPDRLRSHQPGRTAARRSPSAAARVSARRDLPGAEIGPARVHGDGDHRASALGDRARPRPERSPRGPCSCRTRGRRGAEAEGCGTAGTRCRSARRSCAARGAAWSARGTASASGTAMSSRQCSRHRLLEPQLRQLGPARIGLALVVVIGSGRRSG